MKPKSMLLRYWRRSSLGGAAGFGLGRMLCRKDDRDCLMRIAKYGALAGGAGGMLISKFGFMANSREDEMEADRIGFNIAYKAGYHKDYVGKFYERLLQMEKQPNVKVKINFYPLHLQMH